MTPSASAPRACPQSRSTPGAAATSTHIWSDTRSTSCRSSGIRSCSSRMSAILCARQASISARRRKSSILSVTEGDDKPLKYPDAFAAASTMVLSKIDLLAASRLRCRPLHRACAGDQSRHRRAASVGAERRRHGGLDRLADQRVGTRGAGARSGALPCMRCRSQALWSIRSASRQKASVPRAWRRSICGWAC